MQFHSKWGRLLFSTAKWYLIVMVIGLTGFAVGRYEVLLFGFMSPVVTEAEAFLQGDPWEKRSLREKLLLHAQVKECDFGFSGFKVHDTSFTDPGRLMVSRYCSDRGHVVVELIQVDGWRVLHQWLPPIEEILATGPRDQGGNSFDGYSAQHPLLLDDGSIVFHSAGGALVRLSADSQIIWKNDNYFHHSIEQDGDGNIVVSITLKPALYQAMPIVDDGYAVVDVETGKILERRSIAQILVDNGHRGLLRGVGEVEADRIHLNDTQPILRDVGSARRGDIAFSSRHLSTVFLYRPSTNAIIWLKTGPWLTQHDVNLLPDGRFSVFGNDFTRAGFKHDGIDEGVSQVYVYDSATDSVTLPFADVMRELGAFTATEGRSRILSNGDVFVEINNQHRLVRLSPAGVRWEYINPVSEGLSGAVHWCRYLPAEHPAGQWMASVAASR